jgi:hypothetical protein
LVQDGSQVTGWMPSVFRDGGVCIPPILRVSAFGQTARPHLAGLVKFEIARNLAGISDQY